MLHQESLLKRMNDQMGVICFSDTAEHPVLWSQYADHHRGIVLVVDHDKSDQLFRVNYSNNRPTIDRNRLHLPDSDSYQREVLHRMLTTKSRGWEFEHEYRVIAGLSTCQVSDGHYFMPISSDFFKKVILGFRCSIDESYMRSSLDAAGFADVEVTRAHDDNQTYKIHYPGRVFESFCGAGNQPIFRSRDYGEREMEGVLKVLKVLKVVHFSLKDKKGLLLLLQNIEG